MRGLTLFRKLPLYVVLLWIYFGFPTALRDVPDEIKSLPIISLFANMNAVTAAVIGLSLPEIVILRKVLRPRLIATFVGIVAAGILLVGLLFNAVL